MPSVDGLGANSTAIHHPQTRYSATAIAYSFSEPLALARSISRALIVRIIDGLGLVFRAACGRDRPYSNST